jgi:uncharacterized protein (TIGR00304 family)
MVEKWIFLGVFFILLGFFIIFGATLYQSLKLANTGESETEIRSGGIVMIGPFPIIFGSDVESVKFVIILALLLIVITFLLFYPFWKL